MRIKLLFSMLIILCTMSWAVANNDYIYLVSTPQAKIDTNFVVQYEIVSEDSLNYISSYSTGGLGYANSAKSEIVVNTTKTLLFNTNVKSQDISVFNILQDGSLQAVEGSPFHTYYANPANLALHPSGKYLYVGHGVGLCWFSVNEDGTLVLQDTTEIVFYPRGMQISPDGNYLYAADLGGGIRVFSIDASTGALTESPKSPVTYEPMGRTNKIYMAEDSNILYALDLDKGTFGFEITDGDSLKNVSSGPLVNKSTLGSTAAFSSDSRHLFISYSGWIYSYKTFDTPPLVHVGAKPVQTAGIGYFAQLLVHPVTNVLYSFSSYYNVIYIHKADQFGTLSEIHPYIPINSKQDYSSAGAVLVSDFATAINVTNATELTSFTLEQNYPNPFNPKTDIGYQLAEAGKVDLSVYNLLGEKVTTLVHKNQQPGRYTVQWDASGMASGVYIYVIEGANYYQTRKMILIR